VPSVEFLPGSSGGGGGGVGGPTVVYDTPENHGAKRDGATDDTATIQAAINNAVTTAQASGNNYAEVWFSAGIYQVTAAQGGHGTPTFANSQITLPIIAAGTAAQKFTLVLRGVGSGGGVALPHWNQTSGQKSGAVLRTTAVGTNDGTWGPASVIGGPTAIQGYGGGTGNLWSNMLVIVDGLSIVSSTANPTMCGFNFEGLLEAKVRSSGYMADASPATMAGFISSPATFTNQWVYGLMLPTTNNNDLSIVDDWSAEGVWYAIVIGEHAHVRDLRAVYCGWGLMLDNRTATPHWAQVDFASSEINQNGIGLLGAGGTFKLNVTRFDTEGANAGIIWDGNSLMIGSVGVSSNTSSGKFDWTSAGLSNWVGNWGASPTNAHNLRITSADVLPGAGVNQPTIPATTVDFWNKSMRDCAVSVAGGTVTVIAVDGTATGLITGTVLVPAGKKITLTYSVAPTWTWMLL
jgi:hypothetical protein